MTSMPELARPANVAFRPVMSAQPVSILLPEPPPTPALDLLKVDSPEAAPLQIDCRTLIGHDLAQSARALVYATESNGGQPPLYDRVRTSSVALRQLGIDTLEQTNRVIDELFQQENFANLNEATNLLRSLRKDMRKLTDKYNAGDPKVLAFYQNWAPSFIQKVQGIKSVGQLILIDIQPLKAQMSAVEKEARTHLKALDETLAYYDQMLKLAEGEVQNLMYAIAVMEYIMERAKNELEAMPKDDPSDPFNTERDKLGRFIRDLDTKINDFKARLWLSAANAPRILEMGNITQSIALRMVAVMNLVIPSMKQAIIDWNKTAATVEAARFITEVNDTFNEVIQANASATAAAVPTLLRATETPILTVESVYALGKMYDDIVAAVETELALGTQRKQELRVAQEQILGKIVDDKQQITEAYVRSALSAGNIAPEETAVLAKQEDLLLSVEPAVESPDE